MKCSVCDQVLGATWFSIAGRMASGTIHVMNLHRECFDREFAPRLRRKLDQALFRDGWVQETLPMGT